MNQENLKGDIIGNQEQQQQDTCSFKHTISQTMFEYQGPQSVLQIQHLQFKEAQESQYRSKEDLIKQCAQKRNTTFDESQKMLAEAREPSQDKISLITVKSSEEKKEL